MKQIKLGSQGLMIPQIGLGCMGMTNIGAFYLAIQQLQQ